MTTISKKSPPPKWWTKVIDDLGAAAIAAKKSYITPGTVLGMKTDDDTDKPRGYYIRLKNGKIGYFPNKNPDKNIPIGVIIKNELPRPDAISDEPSIVTFARNTISSNVRLIPVMWLNKVLAKLLNGDPITVADDLKEFPKWVALPIDKKGDKTLIDILYKVTRYEGIQGLARFNSYR